MKARKTDKRYKVSESNLYHCALSFVSQPCQYLGTLLLFQMGMLIYFIVTVKLMGDALVAVTSVAYSIFTIIYLAFPFVDPGIIPNILSDYD
jgi:hypothetical protein